MVDFKFVIILFNFKKIVITAIILFLCTVLVMLKVLKLKIQAGIVGFESPASGYVEQSINLDSLHIDKPAATFIG